MSRLVSPLIHNSVSRDGRPALAHALLNHSLTQRRLGVPERAAVTLNRSVRIYRELKREFPGTFRGELSAALELLWYSELHDTSSPLVRRILIEEITLLEADEQPSLLAAGRLTSALITLARLRFDDERFDECMSLLRRAVGLGVRHGLTNLAQDNLAGWQITRLPEWLYRLGEKLAGMGRGEDLEAMLRLGVELGDPSCNGWYGTLLLERGDLTEARAALSMAAEAGDARAMCSLGKLAFHAHDFDETESLWQCAAELDDPDAAYNYGMLLILAGEPEEAELWWLRAAELGNTAGVDGLDAKMCGLLGHLFLGRKDSARGRRWLMLAIQGGDPEAAYWLGSHLLLTGSDEAEGLRLLGIAAEHDPDADVNLGIYYWQHDDRGRAEHYWSRASNAGSTAGRSNLGNLLFERGDYRRAEELARSAWTDGEARACVVLIRALRGLGRAAEAEAVFRALPETTDEAVRQLAEAALLGSEGQETDSVG